MDTGKIYHDGEGNECSIVQMIEREPIWAANRIQEGEKAISELAAKSEPSPDDLRKEPKHGDEGPLCERHNQPGTWCSVCGVYTYHCCSDYGTCQCS